VSTFSVRKYALSDETLVVDLAGELDISSVQDLENELKASDGGPAFLVFDLRKLEFIDSTGLRSILRVESKMRSLGKKVVLVQGPESVKRVFRLTGLDERLEFVSEPSEVTNKESSGLGTDGESSTSGRSNAP
jgi:anti-sigma B factor antagonist